MALTKRQAEVIRLKASREAVAAGDPPGWQPGRLRKAWARHFGIPENSTLGDVLAAMDGLIAEMER